jgi:hypothetical protein
MMVPGGTWAKVWQAGANAAVAFGTTSRRGRFGRPIVVSPNVEVYTMNSSARSLTAAAALALFALSSTASAAPHGVKVGVLTCHVASGWGLVFGSSRDLKCYFAPNHHGGERYAGSISKFGVDIGYTEGGQLIWAVFAPSSDTRRGALEGDYAGATAGVTLGVGLGAHALVGGLDKSIALQPLSVEGNEGLNVAAGIGAISLKYVHSERESSTD